MVVRKSNESADGEAAGGPWQVRDFLSFVWKTHQKRDVADVSQTHPMMSFAENWHRTCRADEALVAKKLQALSTSFQLITSIEPYFFQLFAILPSVCFGTSRACNSKL
jgi:hypothetical protein